MSVTPFHLSAIATDHGARLSEAVALVAGERTLTYGDVDRRSTQVANLLAGRLSPGDRVAYLGPNVVEVPELLFGVAKAGAVFVPINWRLSEREIAAVLADAQAQVILASPAFAAAAARLADAGDQAEPVAVIVVGGADYEALLDGQSTTVPDLDHPSDEVVLQLYTSGTTGAAKGVLTTHANLDGLTTGTTATWQLDGDSVNLAAMPFFHIGGLGWLLVGLHAGARNVIVESIDPPALLDLLERESVTNALLVPTVLAMLTAVPAADDHDFSALRCIAYGASPITTTTLKAAARLFGCPLFQLYGLTETTGAIVQLDAGDHDLGGPREHLLRSAGRPYPGVELRVVDPANGEDVAAGEAGEVWVRARNNTPGYFRRATETAALLSDDGWLRTGDGGYLNSEGYLFLTDRIKDMIVSGAENVYPIEVEEALSQHPDVVEVAVIGVADERWGESVAAVVVPRPGRAPELAELVGFARELLAGYKLPRALWLVDELPKTASGKVLKRELRRRFGSTS